MPHYSSLKVKAKFSFLVAIDQSTDQLIQELKPFLSVPIIRKGLDIPPKCSSILNRAKESITTLPGIKKHCNKQLESIATCHWDDHLNTLQVQKKFSDIVALEKENRSWKKIMNNGLTSGQLSFLLRAGSDTLPTPMNLRRMRIQHDSRCPYARLLDLQRPTFLMDVMLLSIKGDTHGDMTQFCRLFLTLYHACFLQPTSYLQT